MSDRTYAKAKRKVKDKHPLAYAQRVYVKDYLNALWRGHWSIEVPRSPTRSNTIGSGRTMAEAWRNAAREMK